MLGSMYSLVGVAFALGWTPCIGPILATVLFFASTKETVTHGVWLLAVYSAGLGIPFLLGKELPSRSSYKHFFPLPTLQPEVQKLK